MQYDVEFLEEIENNVDLLAYAEQSFDFEKHSRNYFTHCPKHTDKTASLAIDPKNNFFKCFSCGRGGKIINWLKVYEGMSFDEAVEKAAKLAGTDISQMCTSPTVQYYRKLKKETAAKDGESHVILDWSEYDKYQIGEITEWLDEGISQEQIDRFNIRLDKRSNRIVYPVTDFDGNLINVKGRTRFSNYKVMKLAKYINYYTVGQLDYFQGWTENKAEITSEKSVFIFESIKSVMKACDYGYMNAVSAENHQIGDLRVPILLKMGVNTIYLCWDSDVSYTDKSIAKDIDMLKRFFNVFIVRDRSEKLLGGKDGKNSPVDCGKDIWEILLKDMKRI